MRFYVLFLILAVLDVALPLSVSSPVAFDDLSDDELLRPARIIGGEFVRDDEYPFVVGIETKCPNKFKLCTGSVISRKHALTAAHCFYCNDTEKNVSLRLVDLNAVAILLHKSNQAFRGGATVINKKYDIAPDMSSSDVAIVTLFPEYEFNVQPIKLASDMNNFKTLTALGYGYHEERGPNDTLVLKSDLQLRKAELPIFHIDSEWMLAGRAQKMGYHGDSGGPFVTQINGVTYQFGLATIAFGEKTDVLYGNPYDRNITSAFIKISNNCDFIKYYTEGAAQCESIAYDSIQVLAAACVACSSAESQCLDKLTATNEPKEIPDTFFVNLCNQLPGEVIGVSLTDECKKLAPEMATSKDKDALCRTMFSAQALYGKYRGIEQLVTQAVDDSRAKMTPLALTILLLVTACGLLFILYFYIYREKKNGKKNLVP